MSDANMEFEEDVKDQVERNPVRAQLRNLEARNKELEAKLLEATDAQRKLAFVEAGVDLNAPISRYFVKAYDGEMTADAIRQAAQEVNLIEVGAAEMRQHPSVVQVATPAHQPVGVGFLPEPAH